MKQQRQTRLSKDSATACTANSLSSLPVIPPNNGGGVGAGGGSCWVVAGKGEERTQKNSHILQQTLQTHSQGFS